MTRHIIVLAAAWRLAGMGVAGAQTPEPVDDREVKVVAHAPLTYPQIASAARIQGPAVVAVTFDARGTVTDAHALSGMPLLKEAAVDNARRWTFAPSRQRRAVVVYDFQILDSCAVTGQPPPFTVRQTIATVSACTPIVQPQR
jgi:TonB family protein